MEDDLHHIQNPRDLDTAPVAGAVPAADEPRWAANTEFTDTVSGAPETTATDLGRVIPAVRTITAELHEQMSFFSAEAQVSVASEVEELSRLVDHLQLVAAAALDRARISDEVTGSWTTRAGKIQKEYKSTADYLRHRLRISRREAWRRIRLGSSLTPALGLTGQPLEPEFAVLADSAAQGLVSGQAAQLVALAMKRIQGCGTRQDRAAMETALTEVAAGQDVDALTTVAGAWVNHLDPDGTEPSEQQKSELQGLFIRRKYRGLHHLDIFAAEDQFETLLTALSPETNPRTGTTTAGEGTCVDLEGKERPVPADPRSYPQKCLDGLVASCRIALTSGRLPANGGTKPQILAVIPYDQLNACLQTPRGYGKERHHNDWPGNDWPGNNWDSGDGAGKELGKEWLRKDELPPDAEATNLPRASESGMLAFTGPVPARQIRRLACDADIIPVVLSGAGRILDAGVAARYFPPHLRKALTARDGGCAFPGCTAPAPWCEAHHIDYHSHGGSTSTDNGVLLCGFHHHLIHREKWRISVREGVPWFIPPTYVDPFQAPLKNTYFHPLRPLNPHRQDAKAVR